MAKGEQKPNKEKKKKKQDKDKQGTGGQSAYALAYKSGSNNKKT
jgi:hypothetical protein